MHVLDISCRGLRHVVVREIDQHYRHRYEVSLPMFAVSSNGPEMLCGCLVGLGQSYGAD